MQTLTDIFHQGVVAPFLYLLDPNRRIAWVYLLSAALIGLLVYRLVFKMSLKEGLKELFKKEYWWSRSAKTDYILFFVCGICKALWVVPYLSFAGMGAYYLSVKLTEWIGPCAWHVRPGTLLFVYPWVLFLVKDLFVYGAHYLLHLNPYLWEFHKVHHSAETMNPVTLYRMHPVEVLIQNLQGMLAFALVTGVFYYLNTSMLVRATILGVNAFSFVFFMAGANLRHSHVPLRYPRWLEHIFISPYQHQMHHDAQARFCHSNFGSRLAIWDKLFGTLHTSDELPLEKRKFGLPNEGLYCENTWIGNLVSPFVGCYHRLYRRRQKSRS